MTYTREQWCRQVLNDIGNKNPSEDVLNWLVAWTKFETSGPNSAKYNLLNTEEENTSGVVGNFNEAGVKNYDTFIDGCKANAKVLQNGRYPVLLVGLQKDEIIVLKVNRDINGELETWGTGPKQNEINEIMGQGLNDEFEGDLPIKVEPLIMDDIAKAEFQAVIKDLWNTSGIAMAWYRDYVNGVNHGPALTGEFYVDNMTFQFFASSKASWDKKTGITTWTKYT